MSTASTPTYFVIRLLAPRPSFVADMSDQEREVMQRHVVYWTQLLHDGVAIAFGPVADPNGPWGLGLVEVSSPEQVQQIEQNDPAISAALGFRYEVLPMLQAVVRPR